ncbi:MAG: hypothetical protein WAL84_00220 [Candidatus Dormiibacterota bacterium]
MATAAPHVKLLRQLASAKDDYLSGAFDVSWDGARATLYLVFGRPSHAVFEMDQAQIEGEAAIDALLAELPKVFVVSDWRRAMSPRETLSITIDELAGPFVRLAGSYADDSVADESPEWWSAVDDSPDLPFGLSDFPLLPGGRPLWVEASPDEVHLAERLAELPPSIVVLTGAKLRAAAVVSGGDLIDAVWIDAEDHACGETAGMALLGATKGSLAGYALDDPRVAEALTMIWRLPLAIRGIDLTWLDPASMLAAFHADGLDRVLVVDAPVRGIALFSRGGLVAVYSETQRSAVASPERLRSLLSQARGRLTVMERKPRPLAVDAQPQPASAYDFFEVARSESPPGADGAGDEADAPPLGAEVAVDAFAAPPPPPQDEAVPAGANDSPPPPPPVSEPVEHIRRGRRSRWGFGRSRRSHPDTLPAEETAVTLSEADAAAGWSVRQANADAEPAWHQHRVEADDAPVVDEEAVSTPALDAAPEPESIHEESPGGDGDGTAATAEQGPAFDGVSPDEIVPEPIPEPASDTWRSGSWLDDVVDDDAAEPAAESGGTSEPDVADHTDDEAMPEVPQPEQIFRTPGSWNWPLAEPDASDLEPAAVAASTYEDTSPALEDGTDPEFFHRDEPVGSKYVDFDEVRDELVQIGIVWLGETNAVQVTALLSSTRSTIDDFVAAIDTIRGLHLEGQDPASIQAMAREMHQQAAERLSGA